MNGLKELAGVATPLVTTACNLIEKLAGRPCEVAGEMLTDQLILWQWQQRIRIFGRAEEIMKKESIAVRTIPTGFLVPLLEATGKVEDDEIQTLWSNFIASAAESESACETSYIETLRGMSCREARLLQSVATEELKVRSVVPTPDAEEQFTALPEEKLQNFGFDDSDQFWASATRLQSLGVLVLEPGRTQRLRDKKSGKTIGKGTVVRLCFTRYGACFFSKATRTKVNPKSITDPWAGLGNTRSIAFEAGEEASHALTMDQVADAVDQGINSIPIADI